MKIIKFIDRIAKWLPFVILLFLISNCGIYKPVDARKVPPNDEGVLGNFAEVLATITPGSTIAQGQNWGEIGIIKLDGMSNDLFLRLLNFNILILGTLSIRFLILPQN